MKNTPANVCLFILQYNNQLSKWVPINRFNPVIFLCLSQVKTWNFQHHVARSFRVQWVQLRWNVIVRFVDIGGFNDASLFKLSFRNYHSIKIHDTCTMCEDNSITLLLLIDLLLLFNVTSAIGQLFWWQTCMHVGKKVAIMESKNAKRKTKYYSINFIQCMSIEFI